MLGGGLAFLVLAGACGESDKPPIRPPDSSGGTFGGTSSRGGTSGTNGGAGRGAEGGEGGGDGPSEDERAPIVTITSPEHLRHPDDGVVLVDPEVEVVCEATQSPADGSRPVDAALVTIQMLDEDGEVVEDGVVTQTGDDEFRASFFLTDRPNGKVSFRCQAPDTSMPTLRSEDSVSTFVDRGPQITVIAPGVDSAHALGTVSFTFTVEPDPLVNDDAGAEVEADSVRLRVLGVPIEIDEEEPGEFRANVNLADPSMFPDMPSTVPVVISAQNVREPVHGAAGVTYSFVLDAAGPEITVNSPNDLDVVGGEVLLRFTIEDALSEVNPASVSVTINNAPPVFFDDDGPWTRDESEFVYRFDTTQIAGTVSQATINIHAEDIAGNESRGATLSLYLDNQPPVVDLDPPLVREFESSQGTTYCSVAFDPVGAAAANDLAGVLPAQRFRALVWADTNHVDGQLVHFNSPTDESSVFLYLRDQPGPDRPLLVDTDDDGVCDEIAREGLPSLRLNPLPPTGQAWFGESSNDPALSPPYPAFCTERDNSAPDPLCENTSDMSRVIAHDMDGRPPVIYAQGQLGGSGAGCTGVEWEIGFAAEGWICVAGRAADLVGNVGVSPPLRLCYDDRVGPPASCPDPPPSCTDGCSLRPVPEVGPFDPGWMYNPP